MDEINKFNELQQRLYAQRTGFNVDIQNIGKNNQLIVLPVEKSTREIRKGLFMKTDVFKTIGNFSNVYELIWNPKQNDISPTIHSSNKYYYLKDKIEKNPSVIAAVNGAFFFLTDKANRRPKELTYNLCIRNGEIRGLPSGDFPVLFIKEDKLKTATPKAIGKIMIGKKNITWKGAMSKHAITADALLYNSRCSEVVKIRDPKTNIQIGILDEENIYTPRNKNFTDLVINSDSKGNLIVSKINKGGGTHYYNGLFILQFKNKYNFRLGDKVKSITLDKIKLSSIDSAITVGRSVHDSFFYEKVRIERRDARSLLAEDVKGFIHFFIFDGSKYVPGFRGVSAKDISSFFSPDRFKWAYFLDGGGSARIVVREKGELKFLANQFVFRKTKNGHNLWDWERARIMATSILLKIK